MLKNVVTSDMPDLDFSCGQTRSDSEITPFFGIGGGTLNGAGFSGFIAKQRTAKRHLLFPYDLLRVFIAFAPRKMVDGVRRPGGAAEIKPKIARIRNRFVVAEKWADSDRRFCRVLLFSVKE